MMQSNNSVRPTQGEATTTKDDLSRVGNDPIPRKVMQKQLKKPSKTGRNHRRLGTVRGEVGTTQESTVTISGKAKQGRSDFTEKGDAGDL